MENELKFGLLPEHFHKLRRRAKGPGRKQINAYFEAPGNTLKKRGIGLRIRLEDGKRAFLTVKAPSGEKHKRGWHQRQEWESALPVSKAKALMAGRLEWASLKAAPISALRKIFPGLDFKSLRPLGQLKTDRFDLRIGAWLCELDRWSVGSHRFYELELETDHLAVAEKEVRRYLRELSIPVRPRSTTKLAILFKLQKRVKRKTRSPV